MLELKHISKKRDERVILDNISLSFPDTGFIGIQGESGCGKSTLLYIIGMLDSDFEGSVIFNDEEVIDAKKYRRDHISYMMQNKDVISALTVQENILLECQVSGIHYQMSQFKKITQQLGIYEYIHHYPHQLSGGQLKRVSIAKALMKQSSIILCDEPTGALHETQANEVMSLLKKVSQERLVIIVSHDVLLLEKYCDSILKLESGHLFGKIKVASSLSSFHNQKHVYSLIHYPIRQLIHQRKKLIFLFLFQWIMIVAFFIIVTAMNGILDAIKESEIHSVNANIITIENKEREPFTILPSFLNTSIHYHYHLELLDVLANKHSLNAKIDVLPEDTNHILLQSGNLPQFFDEVIVSESLYQSLKGNQNIIFQYGDFQLNLKVCGVLKPSLFSQEEIYCSQMIREYIDFLKDDYSLVVEGHHIDMKNLYQDLSSKYMTYSDVLERIDNYQSLLSLARFVAYLFIFVSLVVSLLLIGIVESIIYYERRHDIAYLISMGLSDRRLYLLSLLEALFLGIVITIGGCMFAHFLYIYINDVFGLKTHLYFELKLIPIFFGQYDLYLLIGLMYIVIVVLGAIMPMRRMKNIDIIETLREE